MDSIFVSLVAYCDNELENTIKDLFEQAKYPERIFIGLVNQDDDVYEPNNPNIRVINIKPEDSPGYGTCRRMCNDELRKDEKYYFQCDPHSRLAKDWDETLINLYNKKKGKHIIVSTASSFDLEGNRRFKWYVYGIKGYHTNAIIEGKKETHRYNLPFDKDGLLKTNMFLAGCVFGESKWADDVSYDSNIFMWGEEFDLSIRTFGEGYTAYLMRDEVLWHLWGHQNRKHIGYVRQRDEFNRLNDAGKEYIYQKLFNNEYKKQDEFFEAENLTMDGLKAIYKKWLMELGKITTIRCKSLVRRNYTTNLMVQIGGEYDIPFSIYKKHPNHFEVIE